MDRKTVLSALTEIRALEAVKWVEERKGKVNRYHLYQSQDLVPVPELGTSSKTDSDQSQKSGRDQYQSLGHEQVLTGLTDKIKTRSGKRKPASSKWAAAMSTEKDNF